MSDRQEFSVDGVRVTFEGGVRGAASRASSGTRSARQAEADDTFDHLVVARGLRIAASVDLDVTDVDPTRTRGAGGNPRITVEPPQLQKGEQCHVLLVQEDSEWHWEFPDPDRGHFELPIEDPFPGERGIVSSWAKKTLKFVAVKALGAAKEKAFKKLKKKAVATAAGLVEKRLRSTRVRTFSGDNYTTNDAAEPDYNSLADGPVALLIHGTNSRTHEAFGSLGATWVKELNSRYDGRVIAFDHPSLSVSPEENARELAKILKENLGDKALELDIMAHSRGGLVARELAERLKPEQVHVRSIVFVATPNNGTALADTEHLTDYVDVLTNLAAVIPDNPVTEAIEVLLGLVEDVALKTAHGNLPGIQCMNPKGDYIQELNALGRYTPPGAKEPVYRAIAADFEPLSTARIARKLRDRLFDVVFDGVMNDLVVPTRSAYLTADKFAVSPDQRVVFDSSYSIDHSGFWRNQNATARMANWLRPDWPKDPPKPVDAKTADANADIESAMARADMPLVAKAVDKIFSLPGAFKSAVEQLAGGPVAQPGAPDSHRGTVIVLPGIMGTLLDAGDERIWTSVKEIHKGGFTRLSLGQDREAIRTAGINQAYTPLVTHLAKQWEVFLFPYDWRRDIFESADKLAKFIQEKVWEGGKRKRPVHLVAHSMGGLVSRAFAVSDKNKDVWNKMDDPNGRKRGGRLIMLGTPNRGSYSIPLSLEGKDMVVKGLAAIARGQGAEEILDTIATFPGVYQMLPSPSLEIEDDHQKLYAETTWGDSPVNGNHLTLAKRFHEELDAGDLDPERLLYIAGDGTPTPARITIDNGFHYGIHDRGDGRVTHKSGILDEDRTYYCKSSHGDLVIDKGVLGAIDELLENGTTENDELPDKPFGRRGREDEEAELRTIPAEDVDSAPVWSPESRGGPARRWRQAELEEAINRTTGLYLPSRDAIDLTRPRLKVEVLHASLEQARHPVAVGHYEGIPIEGAQAFLDWKVNNLLSQHNGLNNYPDQAGEVLYVESPPTCRPIGAIVLGLGEFGGLTPARLARVMTRAAIQRTLRAAEKEEKDAKRKVGIASVLVGTPGRYGLSVESAVGAIVEGVAQAVAKLKDTEAWSRARLEELQIVELYEVRATQATDSARSVIGRLPANLLDAVEVVAPTKLESDRGSRPGLPSQHDSGTSWPRVLVKRKPDDDEFSRRWELQFTMLGRSSQLDQLSVDCDYHKIRSLVAEAVRNPRAVDESLALYELLFPHNAKIEIDETDNLNLLVDKHTATIPWEILTGRWDCQQKAPLAIRTGMLRQFHQEDIEYRVRERVACPAERCALVVGDPPVGAGTPRLPGARAEAKAVADLLEGEGYEVERLIYDDSHQGQNCWTQIQAALVKRRYEIVHFATHGEVDPHDDDCTGLLIGERMRLTALDIKQMSATPKLVFLNACHVGRVGSLTGPGPRSDKDVNYIAANLSLQLMRNGVKAVVAAGWAVDDRAALEFAKKFYKGILANRSYGTVVFEARQEAHKLDNGASNTWGAYQCYGHPGFQLRPGRPGGREDRPPSSPGEMERRLNNCRERAAEASSKRELEGTFAYVKKLDTNSLHLFDVPEVYQALAEAYAELASYEDAIWAYRKAEKHALEGRLPLVVLEQLSNMEVRFATRDSRGVDPDYVAVHPCSDEPEDLFERALGRLNSLNGLEETSERFALLGSCYKKRGTTRATRREKMKDLRLARAAYTRAWEISQEETGELDPYHTDLSVQMTGLSSSSESSKEELRRRLNKLETQQEDARKEARKKSRPSTFWDDTAPNDLIVSRAVLGDKKFTDAFEGYKDAFAKRSSVRERDSVLDHLQDLCELMRSGDKENITTLISDLEQVSL